MKLMNLPISLALMTLLTLSTACNSAKFTGKSGVKADDPNTSAPVETTPGTETPVTPGTTTPGTTPENPGSTETPDTTPGTPGTTTPTTPGTTPPVVTPGTPTTPTNPTTPTPPTTVDPNCGKKGTCDLPCDPTKTQCVPVPTDECTFYGINCPGQSDDDPTQNDDPDQGDDASQH